MHGVDYILGIVTGLLIGFAAGAGVAAHISSKKNEQTVYTLSKEKTDISSNLMDEKEKTGQLECKIDELTEEISRKASPPEDDLLREPYVITEEQFQFMYPYSNDMDLTYFQQDNVLIGPNGEPIDDILEYVGAEGEWAIENTEDDVIYIHNDELDLNLSVNIEHTNRYEWPNDMGEEDNV